jgi:O-antigen/teichoic acid export membrane protein
VIVTSCFLFPKEIIGLLFGSDYITISSLLWKYALATSIFAISNIFAYYFLSLDTYIPVALSGIFGMLQIVLIVFYHETLAQVVHVQIIAMILLLIVQLGFFLCKGSKTSKSINHIK